eukprot:3032643-Pyramimonas_sp.AAC.1
MAQIFGDAERAILRGLGPAKRAEPLPLEQYVSDDFKANVAVAARPEWPAAGVDAAVVACAWLLREVESSSAFLRSVELFEAEGEEDGPCGWATWHLPASKADPAAL